MPEAAAPEAAPSVQAAEPAFTARIRRYVTDGAFFVWLRMIALFAVLEKELGPRLFLPQNAAAEGYTPSRFIYYTEFIISIAVLVLGILHFARLARYMVKAFDILVFLFFVGMTVFFGAASSDAFEMAFGAQHLLIYIEAYLALAMVIQCDGVAAARRILVQFFGFAVIANALSIAAPQMSITAGGNELAGTFRGLMIHRGDLGFVLLLAVTMFNCYIQAPLIRWGLIGLSMAMLVGAGSAQGMILVLSGFILVPFFRAQAGFNAVRGITLFTLIGAMVFLYVVTPSVLDAFLGIFGRDSSLTGRTDVWQVALYMIGREPFWGYGLNQFTNQTIPVDLLSIYRLQYVTFASTHSAYLEAIFELGFIGSTAFFVCVGRLIFLWIQRVFAGRYIQDAYPYALTVFCVIGGISAAEKMFMAGAGWFSFMMARQLLDAERS